MFEDSSLEDIRDLIMNNYGQKVVIKSPELLARKITATIPSTKLTVLLTILEETLGIDIIQQGKSTNLPRPKSITVSYNLILYAITSII